MPILSLTPLGPAEKADTTPAAPLRDTSAGTDESGPGGALSFPISRLWPFRNSSDPLPMRISVGLLLLLSACGIPVQETNAHREERIRTGVVCAAYDDLRGRLVVDSSDPEQVELHRSAMKLCDQVEAEGAALAAQP